MVLGTNKAVEKGQRCNAVYIQVCKLFEMFHFRSENSKRPYHTSKIRSDFENPNVTTVALIKESLSSL